MANPIEDAEGLISIAAIVGLMLAAYLLYEKFFGAKKPDAPNPDGPGKLPAWMTGSGFDAMLAGAGKAVDSAALGVADATGLNYVQQGLQWATPIPAYFDTTQYPPSTVTPDKSGQSIPDPNASTPGFWGGMQQWLDKYGMGQPEVPYYGPAIG